MGLISRVSSRTYRFIPPTSAALKKMRLTKRQNVSVTCLSLCFNYDNNKVAISDAFGNVHCYHNIHEEPQTAQNSPSHIDDAMDDGDAEQRGAFVNTISVREHLAMNQNAQNLTNISEGRFVFWRKRNKLDELDCGDMAVTKFGGLDEIAVRQLV